MACELAHVYFIEGFSPIWMEYVLEYKNTDDMKNKKVKERRTQKNNSLFNSEDCFVSDDDTFQIKSYEHPYHN